MNVVYGAKNNRTLCISPQCVCDGITVSVYGSLHGLNPSRSATRDRLFLNSSLIMINNRTRENRRVVLFTYKSHLCMCNGPTFPNAKPSVIRIDLNPESRATESGNIMKSHLTIGQVGRGLNSHSDDFHGI